MESTDMQEKVKPQPSLGGKGIQNNGPVLPRTEAPNGGAVSDEELSKRRSNVFESALTNNNGPVLPTARFEGLEGGDRVLQAERPIAGKGFQRPANSATMGEMGMAINEGQFRGKAKQTSDVARASFVRQERADSADAGASRETPEMKREAKRLQGD